MSTDEHDDELLGDTAMVAALVGRKPPTIRKWKDQGYLVPVYEPGSSKQPPGDFDGKSSVYRLGDVEMVSASHPPRSIKTRTKN